MLFVNMSITVFISILSFWIRKIRFVFGSSNFGYMLNGSAHQAWNRCNHDGSSCSTLFFSFWAFLALMFIWLLYATFVGLAIMIKFLRACKGTARRSESTCWLQQIFPVIRWPFNTLHSRGNQANAFETKYSGKHFWGHNTRTSCKPPWYFLGSWAFGFY